MFTHNNEDRIEDTAESGFVLVLSMVILLMLSLFGIWALQTSTSEIQVAGGSQEIESQFNVTEGSAYSESGKVGFTSEPHYVISDPNDLLQILVPLTDADIGPGDFDPGADTASTRAPIAARITGYSGAVVPTAEWPWENMLLDYAKPSTNNEFDYRYLTTYLFPDMPPLGYDANFFRAYKFRIQTAATTRPLVVEVGGAKIGPR